VRELYVVLTLTTLTTLTLTLAPDGAGGGGGVAQQPTASCSRADAAMWVFVSPSPQAGSFAMRGQQTAALLSQDVSTRSNDTTIEAMSCEDACGAAARARFDAFLRAERCGQSRRRLLVTHVKYVCECLLRSRPGLLAATTTLGDHPRNVFHVFDTVRPNPNPDPNPNPNPSLSPNPKL